MGFERELQPDERIIIDEQKIALRDKIVLTNKRLVILSPKGFLSSTFVKSSEIPLTDLSEAQIDIKSFTGNSSMILKLKNGDQKEIRFDPGGAITVLGSVAQVLATTNAITSKWVNTINRAIDKKE